MADKGIYVHVRMGQMLRLVDEELYNDIVSCSERAGVSVGSYNFEAVFSRVSYLLKRDKVQNVHSIAPTRRTKTGTIQGFNRKLFWGTVSDYAKADGTSFSGFVVDCISKQIKKDKKKSEGKDNG